MALSPRAGTKLALGTLCAAVALTTGSAYSAGLRAQVQAVFPTETPGASSGRTENGDFVDPAVPGGKPHSVKRVVLELAPGARFDTTAIPQCSATDAELMLQGPTACPANTQV